VLNGWADIIYTLMGHNIFKYPTQPFFFHTNPESGTTLILRAIMYCLQYNSQLLHHFMRNYHKIIVNFLTLPEYQTILYRLLFWATTEYASIVLTYFKKYRLPFFVPNETVYFGTLMNQLCLKESAQQDQFIVDMMNNYTKLSKEVDNFTDVMFAFQGILHTENKNSVQHLVKLIPYISIILESGTPMAYAIQNMLLINVIKFIYEQAPNILNQPTSVGTPMSPAIEARNVAAVKFLHSKGA
ncbi:hypothetical protein HK098_005983, partial [Nowakowskiella sp. JEL0407]